MTTPTMPFNRYVYKIKKGRFRDLLKSIISLLLK